jgi:HSP20 family molecular chaperone IbpA
LKISGKRKPEGHEMSSHYDVLRCICIERAGSDFMRKFNLPPDVVIENISACFQRGLLFISLPKKPRSHHKLIKDLDIKILS